MVTNVFTGVKKELKSLARVVTPSVRKVSELGINAAQPKATPHEEPPARIGNI